MNIDPVYANWNKVALDIIEGKIPSWKKDSKEICSMLEHVNQQYAQVYLTESLKELTIQQISDYVKMCDSVGNPYKIYFQEFDAQVSTTCLRYLYHALCVLKDKIEYPIVEIGGGYGGLALAIDFVSKIKNIQIDKYIIIDFPNIQKLQEYYLNHFSLSFPVSYESKVEEPCYIISNYCIAEMGEENRQYYFQNLIIPYGKQGFFVWNSNASINSLEHHFNVQVYDEIPKTGPNNKFIKFQKLI
jgi:hypothetical protein